MARMMSWEEARDYLSTEIAGNFDFYSGNTDVITRQTFDIAFKTVLSLPQNHELYFFEGAPNKRFKKPWKQPL